MRNELDGTILSTDLYIGTSTLLFSPLLFSSFLSCALLSLFDPSKQHLGYVMISHICSSTGQNSWRLLLVSLGDFFVTYSSNMANLMPNFDPCHWSHWSASNFLLIQCILRMNGTLMLVSLQVPRIGRSLDYWTTAKCLQLICFWGVSESRYVLWSRKEWRWIHCGHDQYGLGN